MIWSLLVTKHIQQENFVEIRPMNEGRKGKEEMEGQSVSQSVTYLSPDRGREKLVNRRTEAGNKEKRNKRKGKHKKQNGIKK